MGTVVVIVTLTSGNKVVSDPTNRIAMTVPKTWSNDTTDDAGQWVEQGEDSYAVPDLEVSGFGGLVTALIADRADTSLTEVHEAEVEEACDVIGCLSHGQRVEVDVNGRRGLEQVLRHRDDEVTILMTIESNTLVVNLAGETWAPPGDRDVEKLTAVMHTLTVHR